MVESNRETGCIEKDSISEVMSDLVFMGRVCAGCLSSIGMSPNLEYSGVECFCKDELTPYLADAHDGLRWCSEDCLHDTHEDPTWPDIGGLNICVK